MHRYLLATTAVLALGAPAAAATISTKVTQPVRTSTANSGAADAVAVAAAGSVVLTSGTAVTMDSNHVVTNNGTVTVSNANDAIGIRANAGTSGEIVNTGTIMVDEAYTPTDADKDGDLDGPFAVGSNRTGILTAGAHTGRMSNSGTITVEGNDSAGILLAGSLTGDFLHDGKTNVLGDRSTGVSAGAITGKIRLAGTVSAVGKDAVAARFAGDVTGPMVVQGTIAATGYRSTTAPSNVSKLDADDLLQGGSALVIEGNVTGGIVLAVAPKDANTSDADEDKDGIEDAKEGSAVVMSYGAAPAMVIGATDRAIVIGSVANTPNGYGLIVEGTVGGSGVYSGVDGNGLVIGGRGGAVTVAKGVGISGTVSATSNGANATALRFGAGASTPELRVSGTISATGGNAATAQTTAIQLDAGADLATVRNSGSIKATAAGVNGNATAILDRSGNLQLVENSGAISASGAAADSTRNIAIDLSANTAGATVKQLQVAANFTAPTLAGDVRFGSGNDRFEVADGTVKGNAWFGAGNNTLTFSGDAVHTGKAVFGAGNDAMSLSGTSGFNGTADFGGGIDRLSLTDSAVFTGALVNSGGLAINVAGGTLSLTKPSSIGELTVGANGILAVTLDKTAGQGTAIDVAGNASFTKGATLSVRLADLTSAEGRYVVLEAGSLSGLSGVTTKTDLVPFIYKATVASDAGAGQLAIDVARRTAAELGLNKAQTSAYGAVFAAMSKDEDVAGVFLGITDGDQFRSAVRQMLPDHAGAAFHGISLGRRAISRQLADPQSPVARFGDFNIYLTAAGWGADKDLGDTAAYDLNGLGASLSGELVTGIGHFGASATWLWNEWNSGGDDNNTLSDTYELGAYWRGQWGGFAAHARGAIGKADFTGRRNFSGMAGQETVTRQADSEWDGTLTSFNAGMSFEGGWQYVFFRPTVSVDYLKLAEDGYTDTGGGNALNLTVEDRTSDELAVEGGLVLGVDFTGRRKRDTTWFRIEGEGGWREIVGGSLGATTAHFAGGGSFTIAPEKVDSGWYARLRAIGGAESYELGGEVGAESRFGSVGLSVRGTVRLGF